MDDRSPAEIARRHRVRLLLQHGSSVAGQPHAQSDVDIAVIFDDGDASFERLGALASDLEPLFPGREVDLAPIGRADPLFLKKVVENCRLLAGTERDLHELRMLAFKRYQDHRRFLALERPFVRRVLDSIGGR